MTRLVTLLYTLVVVLFLAGCASTPEPKSSPMPAPESKSQLDVASMQALSDKFKFANYPVSVRAEITSEARSLPASDDIAPNLAWIARDPGSPCGDAAKSAACATACLNPVTLGHLPRRLIAINACIAAKGIGCDAALALLAGAQCLNGAAAAAMINNPTRVCEEIKKFC
jgi:hypothetical protein